MTVTLHATRERAEQSKRVIDANACGGTCWRWHEVVELRGPDHPEPIVLDAPQQTAPASQAPPIVEALSWLPTLRL